MPADIEEKKRKRTSDHDEDFWAESDDDTYSTAEECLWRCPDFGNEDLPPCFVAPLNDIFIEFVYTIKLEQEVLSVNNEVHCPLANLPARDLWFKANSECCTLLSADSMTSLTIEDISPDKCLSRVSMSIHIFPSKIL